MEETTDNSSSSITCSYCNCWQTNGGISMPKYKVGNWVALEGCGDKIKYRVLGILEDTCSAGKQIYYNVRPYIKTEGYGLKKEDNNWYPTKQKEGFALERFNEIELIPYIEKVNSEKD